MSLRLSLSYMNINLGAKFQINFPHNTKRRKNLTCNKALLKA